MQITADVFNMPAFRPHTYETSSLGAAIDAAVGMKFYNDYTAAVGSMTHIGEQFLPDSKNAEMYNQLYEKVYLKMYTHLQPLYEQIRNVTGYPAKI
jgi:sugar (pentulose or hexulose) kinase